MVDIKKIRIGNLLDFMGTTHIVDGVSSNNNMIESWEFKDGQPVYEYEFKDIGGVKIKSPTNEFAKEYYGIPLTSEILSKQPYAEMYKPKIFYENVFLLKLGNNHFMLRPSYEDGFYWGVVDGTKDEHYDNPSEPYSCIPLKYVHELQNWGLIVSGEELPIKL